MHIRDNLVNFLYDKEYFISMYDNYIHIFNYKELISLTSNLIILKLEKFNLSIKGEDLFIIRMLPNELLIKGIIKNVGIDYE